MMNAGDTGFMMICTAFVFFMTPGLAFFYGGLVRRKNVVNTMMACGAIMGLSVVMWTLFGYSLAFGGNHGGTPELICTTFPPAKSTEPMAARNPPSPQTICAIG